MATCNHESLGFVIDQGTFILKCNHCDARWMAIDKNRLPRIGAHLEGPGIDPIRQSTFYTRPFLQVHKVQNALNSLRVDDKLRVNLPEILGMLYSRPQLEVEDRFKSEVLYRYEKLPLSESTKRALLEDAKSFLKRIVSSYMPR